MSHIFSSMLSDKHLKRARNGNMKGDNFAVNGLLVLGFDEGEPLTKVAKNKVLSLFESYKYKKPKEKKQLTKPSTPTK